MVSVVCRFGRLTDRQRAALGLAAVSGDCRVPGHVRTEDLARRRGISRRRFGRLLRWAESQPLRALLPYIAGAVTPPPPDQP
ncbi:MAG: helix-turn-helix domain-containing protein [Thermoplasmata archaeon]